MINKLGILALKKKKIERRTKTYMYLKKLETNYIYQHRRAAFRNSCEY